MSDPYAGWDAAYVLGTLTSQERRAFEEHLRICLTCATDVQELAGMPALLATAEPGAFASPARPDIVAQPNASAQPLPPTVLPTLLERTRRHRRRVRAAISVAVLAAVTLAGALVYLPRHHTQKPLTQALDQVVTSPLHAQIRLVAESWGTRVDVLCQDDGHGQDDERTSGQAQLEQTAATSGSPATYLLVITDRSGNRISAGSWSAEPGSTVEPTTATRVPLAQIARVQVISNDGRVLLQLDR